ncbi:MAG: 30S ribosomal protein S12 methylthiotransferase RimO [Syntrophobacteraceae bacterium]
MKYASLISLGCAKNLIDSETMVKQLVDMGYRMTDAPAEAELILINTCGFLESAVREAIDAILETARYKETGKCRKLVAAGCMVQRYGKKLLGELPEVDLFLGTSHYHELESILQANLAGDPRRLWIARPIHSEGHSGRVRSTGSHTAYLKIAEGCGNSCSFCIIPHLRGPLRSRSESHILAEAAALASEGVREINLVAQDTTAFGLDRQDPHALRRLLEKLDGVPGLAWIRLLYAYPDRIGDDLLGVIAASSKIVPYLDIPIQHCVPKILEKMGRPPQSPEKILEKIRSAVPGIALRTSIMVGFPGETAADFRALVSFMERVRFDHAGVFAYSPETGTRAARFPRRPGKKVAEGRRAELLEVQREISRHILQKRVGEVVSVLIEGPHPETELLVSGRLPTQAPEVDGNVIITAGDCTIGEIRNVKITASHDYDLEGQILAERQ